MSAKFEALQTVDNAIGLLIAGSIGQLLDAAQREEIVLMLRFYRVSLQLSTTTEATAEDALAFVHKLRDLSVITTSQA